MLYLSLGLNVLLVFVAVWMSLRWGDALDAAESCQRQTDKALRHIQRLEQQLDWFERRNDEVHR
jgi:hypothetical protein